MGNLYQTLPGLGVGKSFWRDDIAHLEISGLKLPTQYLHTLQMLNNALFEQKIKKEDLVAENKKVQQFLIDERKSQQRLIRSLKFRSHSLSENIKQNSVKQLQ